MIKYSIGILVAGLLLIGCSSESAKPISPVPDAIALDGSPLFSPPPARELVDRFDVWREAYLGDPTDIDNIIWFGRFMGYAGEFERAIEVYTSGIEIHPNDARLYRHRGHRYITVRKFELAIADFEKAASLVEGTENEIEPDGMPNARGIPVSTLHGNIWYHLGLAHYLNHDMDNALSAYTRAFESGELSDNVVSTTHWIYMILRRMGRVEEAARALEVVSPEMDIIENVAYHQLTLFYKGLLSEEELSGEGSAGDAIQYGLANWYLYNGNETRSRELMEELLSRDSWGSFGYIAAESDWQRYFKSE